MLNTRTHNIVSFSLSVVLTLFIIYSNRSSTGDTFFNFSSLIALAVLGLNLYIFVQEMRNEHYEDDIASWSKYSLLILVFISGYYASFNNIWLTYSSNAGLNVGKGMIQIGNQGVGIGRGLLDVNREGVGIGKGFLEVDSNGIRIGNPLA